MGCGEGVHGGGGRVGKEFGEGEESRKRLKSIRRQEKIAQYEWPTRGHIQHNTTDTQHTSKYHHTPHGNSFADLLVISPYSALELAIPFCCKSSASSD